MRSHIEVILLIIAIKIRWAYFHVCPWYFKFYMDSGKTEAHFQNMRKNTLHSQLIIEFNEDSPWYKAK